jgi:Tfp pilus assembly protein PilP
MAAVRIADHRRSPVLDGVLAGLALLLTGCGSSQTTDLQEKIAEADARTAAAEKRLAAATAAEAHPVPHPVLPVVTQPPQEPVAIDISKGSTAQRNEAPFRDSRSGPNNDIP